MFKYTKTIYLNIEINKLYILVPYRGSYLYVIIGTNTY